MTIRLCRTCRDWHDVDQPWPCAVADDAARSSFPTPMVQGDSIPHTVSQIDGTAFTSKSKLFSHYRAHGAHVIPKGYRAPPPTKAPIAPVIERAFAKAGI